MDEVQLNPLERGLQFLRESWQELKKVSWSSRQEVAGATVFILLLVLVLALFVGLVDFVISRALALVLR